MALSDRRASSSSTPGVQAAEDVSRDRSRDPEPRPYRTRSQASPISPICMLPDFPKVKQRGSELVARLVAKHIRQMDPLLERVQHFRVHEGAATNLRRADSSTDRMDFTTASAETLIAREDMRRMNHQTFAATIRSLAEQFARQQVHLMLERVSQATAEVGNTVSAAEIGPKEAFLEMERRLSIDFDPQTLEPKDLVLVLHPSQVERFKAQAAEWEADPAFREELASIRRKQLEAWRAREDSRKLVD